MMLSKSASLMVLAVASRMIAALTVTTLSVPGVQPSDAPDLVWDPIGTGSDGHTTYAVHASEATGSNGLGVFTATVALGATDAVVYESEAGAGAVTESCAWGAGGGAATCIMIGPSVSGSVTATGTETFTVSVGPVPVTLAAAPSASTSGTTETAVTKGPTPTANPSSAGRTVAFWTPALSAVIVSFFWVL